MVFEDHLQKNGFDLKGRIVLCGYQEDAVANYYTAEGQEIIDDEVSKKTNAGWQFLRQSFWICNGVRAQGCKLHKKICKKR